MEKSKEIAADLHEIQAVQLRPDDPFTWTSGIKSPIYCDNRLTLSYPAIREKIADAFVEIIEQLEEKPDVIAGCATAGIPHAAWVAQKLNLPMVYVRSKPKSHGKGNQIEGSVAAGQKAVVIEDLISTGGSSINSAEALKAEGVQVLCVAAIFTYGLQQAADAFESANINLKTITSLDFLLDVLKEKQVLSSTEQEQLITWRNGFK